MLCRCMFAYLLFLYKSYIYITRITRITSNTSHYENDVNVDVTLVFLKNYK